MKMELKKDNVEQYCIDFMNKWQQRYFTKDFTGAVALCISFINDIKPAYKDQYLSDDKNDYTYAYVYLVLAKGLQDLAELTPLTSEKYWPHDGQKTETIWCKMWDAKYRFSFFLQHWLGDPNVLDKIAGRINGLESFFYDTFGKGLYFSPDIVIKKAECTVCGKNIKACSHMLGHIYEGIRCTERVLDLTFESISIVESPHDMRCRLWPWNMKEDRTITGMFMSLNTIDSFIHE